MEVVVKSDEVLDAQQWVDEYDTVFRVGRTLIEPSSWWYVGAIRLPDTDIPPYLRSYCEWQPYEERYTGNWYWHPPHHILCLEDETDFLVAQKGRREWICYKPDTQEWIHTRGGSIQNIWSSLHDVFVTLCPERL